MLAEHLKKKQSLETSEPLLPLPILIPFSMTSVFIAIPVAKLYSNYITEFKYKI